jgi:hypothetical protein
VSDDYQDAAGIPVSRPAEITYLLRCLSVDCEWQVFEVEEYIKQIEADRDVLAAEVRAWRDADASHKLLEVIDACDVYGHRHAVENAQKEVDASGALTRAKEAK